MARPTKLGATITYEVEVDGQRQEQTITVGEAIVRAIRLGVPRKAAANSAGVAESSLHDWLARGRELAGMADKDLTANQRQYAEFAEAVQKADGSAIAYNVGVVRAAAKKQWQAAAWWLERRYPDDFGRRLKVEDDGERKPAPVDRETMSEYEEAFASSFAGGLPELDPSELLPPELGDEE